MTERPDHCERCGRADPKPRLGVFNDQYLCASCGNHEHQHADYAQADAAVRQALARGQTTIRKLYPDAKTWADLGMQAPQENS